MTSPSDSSSSEHRAELARILARAALRLHRRGALAPTSPDTGPHAATQAQIPEERPRNRLDFAATQSVHGRVVDTPERAGRKAVRLMRTGR